MKKLNLKVKKLDENAKLPTKSYSESGELGLDFYALETVKIPANGHVLIRTGVSVQFEQKGYGLILFDKSGMAVKRKLHTMAGVIDASYTGEIVFVCHNTSNKNQKVAAGESMVQGVVQEIFNLDIEEVDVLDKTDRGDKGFGSSKTNGNANDGKHTINELVDAPIDDAPAEEQLELVDDAPAEEQLETADEGENTDAYEHVEEQPKKAAKKPNKKAKKPAKKAK